MFEQLESLKLSANFTPRERRYFDKLRDELEAIAGGVSIEELTKPSDAGQAGQIRSKLEEIWKFVQDREMHFMDAELAALYESEPVFSEDGKNFKTIQVHPSGDKTYFHGQVGADGVLFGPQGRISPSELFVHDVCTRGDEAYYLASDAQKAWHIVTPTSDVKLVDAEPQLESFLVTPDGQVYVLVEKKPGNRRETSSYYLVNSAGEKVSADYSAKYVSSIFIKNNIYIFADHWNKIEIFDLDGNVVQVIDGEFRFITKVSSGRAFCACVRNNTKQFYIQEIGGDFQSRDFLHLDGPMEFEGELLYCGQLGERDSWQVYNERGEIVETLPEGYERCTMQVHNGVLCYKLNASSGVELWRTGRGNYLGHIKEVVPFGSTMLAIEELGSSRTDKYQKLATFDYYSGDFGDLEHLCSLDNSTVVYARRPLGPDSLKSDPRATWKVCLTRETDFDHDGKYINRSSEAEQEYLEIFDIRPVESLPPDSGYFLVVGIINDHDIKKHVQHLYRYDKDSGEFGRVGI